MRKDDWRIEGDELEPKVREKLIMALKKDYEELQKYFHEEKYGEMARTLGEQVILASPEGDLLRGKGCLVRYWRGERERGVRRLEFNPVYIYVQKVTKPVERKDAENTVLHVAHEISEFRLISEAQNSTGSWTRTLPHPRICEWEP